MLDVVSGVAEQVTQGNCLGIIAASGLIVAEIEPVEADVCESSNKSVDPVICM